MNRECEFRGMDLQGRWFYGNLAILNRDLKSTGNKAGHYISNAAGAPFAYAVRPETVGQYTGLKDRNGRKVYHKDLWHFHGLTYTVEWDEEYAMFYLKHPSERATYDDHMKLFVLYQGEIVGNAFEGKVAMA